MRCHGAPVGRALSEKHSGKPTRALPWVNKPRPQGSTLRFPRSSSPPPCRTHRRKYQRKTPSMRRRNLRCVSLSRSRGDVGSPDARAHQFNHGAAGAKTAVVGNADFVAATTTRLDPWSRDSRTIFAGCFISFMCAASCISRAFVPKRRLKIERRSRTVMMDR